MMRAQGLRRTGFGRARSLLRRVQAAWRVLEFGRAALEVAVGR